MMNEIEQQIKYYNRVKEEINDNILNIVQSRINKIDNEIKVLNLLKLVG